MQVVLLLKQLLRSCTRRVEAVCDGVGVEADGLGVGFAEACGECSVTPVIEKIPQELTGSNPVDILCKPYVASRSAIFLVDGVEGQAGSLESARVLLELNVTAVQ